MTQLVELQKHIGDFEAEGIKIYGISYDSQEDLKRFADNHGITYDLLSDVDSAVIKKFGILNTLIDPEDPLNFHPTANMKFSGIPFPGTYVTDASGVVTEKFFNRHYATRDSAGTILDSALGKNLIHEESPQAGHQDQRAKITAFLADSSFQLEVKTTLIVRLEMAAGLHIYGAPLPEGFVPTTVEVKPAKGFRLGDPIYPRTKAMKFDALDATLNVYEGVVDIEIPITTTAEVLGWGQKRDVSSVPLEVTVRYQACTDKVCYAPETVKLTLDVPLTEHITPGRGRPRGADASGR